MTYLHFLEGWKNTMNSSLCLMQMIEDNFNAAHLISSCAKSTINHKCTFTTWSKLFAIQFLQLKLYFQG